MDNTNIEQLVEQALNKRAQDNIYQASKIRRETMSSREKLLEDTAIRLNYGRGVVPLFLERYSDSELEALTPERYAVDWSAAGLSVGQRPLLPAERAAQKLENERRLAITRRRTQEHHLRIKEEQLSKLRAEVDVLRQKVSS